MLFDRKLRKAKCHVELVKNRKVPPEAVVVFQDLSESSHQHGDGAISANKRPHILLQPLE
jgi:hypothetical protein